MSVRFTRPFRDLSNIDVKNPNSMVTYDKVVNPFEKGPNPPECAGITARIPLNMNAGQDFTNDTVLTDYTITAVSIDPSDYPGLVAAWWKLEVDSATGTLPNYTARLVDEFGVIYATVTIANGLPFVTLLPLVPFVPNAAPRKYMLRLPASASSFDLTIHNMEILLDVVNSSKIKVQIPLMINAQGFAGGNGNAAQNNLFGEALDVQNQPAFSTVVEVPIILKEAGVWQNITGWELEVIAALPGGGNPSGQIAIFNNTTSLIVAASTIMVPSPTPAPLTFTQTFADSALNFAFGDEFVVNFLFAPLASTMFIYRAALYVSLDCAEGEVHAQVFNRVGATCFTVNAGQIYDVGARTTIDLALYGVGAQFFYEVTGDQRAGVPSADLWDGGLNVTGIAGAAVAGSALDALPPLTPVRRRSPALVLVSGNNYLARTSAANADWSFVKFVIAQL
jgi:hypothetical protein